MPINNNKIGMYVCGPTIYDFPHIGNARPLVVFDVLYRLLLKLYAKNKITYVRNITDIDDKIIESSKKNKTTIKELTETITTSFHEDCKYLNCLQPNFEPRATEHIQEMISMVDNLIKNKNAYENSKHVYFSVSSFKDYGKLSNKNSEELVAGSRVEVSKFKKDPLDFVLWKPSESNDPGWDSPWGRGRPGWHLECSVMSEKFLGKKFDIHGGGLDLVFPHHENEIAQSECAHGEIMANYWMHNGFLDMGGEKMSKSLGNVVLVHELLKQWHGEVLRFAMLSGHYRAPLDWTEDLLKQAKTTLDRIYGALRRVWDAEGGEVDDRGVFDALCDDLNTPEALASLSRIAGEANMAADKGDTDAMATARANLLDAGEMLGLLTLTPKAWEQGGDDDGNDRINGLVQARIDARAAKDWAEADRIRDQLAAEGIEIMDGAGGSTWRRI